MGLAGCVSPALNFHPVAGTGPMAFVDPNLHEALVGWGIRACSAGFRPGGLSTREAPKP